MLKAEFKLGMKIVGKFVKMNQKNENVDVGQTHPNSTHKVWFFTTNILGWISAQNQLRYLCIGWETTNFQL